MMIVRRSFIIIFVNFRKMTREIFCKLTVSRRNEKDKFSKMGILGTRNRKWDDSNEIEGCKKVDVTFSISFISGESGTGRQRNEMAKR